MRQRQPHRLRLGGYVRYDMEYAMISELDGTPVLCMFWQLEVADAIDTFTFIYTAERPRALQWRWLRQTWREESEGGE